MHNDGKMTAVPPACQQASRREEVDCDTTSPQVACLVQHPPAPGHRFKGVSELPGPQPASQPCSRRIYYTSDHHPTHLSATLGSLPVCQPQQSPTSPATQPPEAASPLQRHATIVADLRRFCASVRGTRANMSMTARSRLKISRPHPGWVGVEVCSLQDSSLFVRDRQGVRPEPTRSACPHANQPRQ